MSAATPSVSLTNADAADRPLLQRPDDANKESTTLLWFDPNIGSFEDTERTKENLRSINDFVIFHTNLDQCVAFIKSIEQEQIFLITSGSKASKLLPLVAHLRQVNSIFIFCMKDERYQHLISEYSKIIGIYAQLDKLSSSIRHEIDLFDKQLQTFSVFDHHQKSTKDLSQQSGEFLWLQLFHHIIVRLPREQEAKQKMIDVCRQYYRGNNKDLALIDQFERDYRPEEVTRWYSRQSFVYKMVNKALRSEDLDQLHTFRFYIRDLSQTLSREHQKLLLSDETRLLLYRGAVLGKEEFEKLRESVGRTISTNGYLSTSRLRHQALTFAEHAINRTDVVGVMFEIVCDVQQLGKSIVYADVAALSDFPAEQEVLFDLNASFRLDSIEEDESMHVIRMTATNDGEKITKDYVARTQQQTEEQSVSIVFGRLMFDLGHYDKSKKYFEDLLTNPESEDLAWIEFNIGRALRFKGAWKEAREHYDRAYERMMQATPAREKDSAEVLSKIGVVLYDQGKYEEALDYHQRALKIREKLHPSGHVDVATSLNNIGNILRRQGSYDEALEYYKRALNLREQCYPSGHVDVAATLNSIGTIFRHQLEYDEAQEYYQRALLMKEKFYPASHVNIATTVNNIGVVLQDQRRFAEAINHHQRGLRIREKCYPSGHADVATSLNNIGICYEGQNDTRMALEYYCKALSIYETLAPAKCVNHGRVKRNIRRITK